MNPDRPLVLRLLDTASLAFFAMLPYAVLHFVLVCHPENLPFRDALLWAAALVWLVFAGLIWRSSDVLVKIQRAFLLGGTGFFLVFAVAPAMRHPVLARAIGDRLGRAIPFLGELFRDGAGMMALAVVGLFWTMFCGVGFLFVRLLRHESAAPRGP